MCKQTVRRKRGRVMTREEAVKMLQATRLMLMDGANQPISDLYYALDMAIETLEQTEPTWEQVKEYCNKRCLDIVDSTMRKLWYKDEPQLIAEDINRRVEMGKKAWKAGHIEDEPHIVGKHADVIIIDEPQTYVINPQAPTNDDKCFECDDFFTCGGQCNKVEDKPKTERSE